MKQRDASYIVQRLLEDEPTSQWPEDFQAILFDYLEQLGFEEFPESVPVKTVPIKPLLGQAQAMGYDPGDERAKPEYQAGITAHVQGRGKLPPLIVRGDELLDGRHRLRALAGHAQVVSVIDLNDLSPHAETEQKLYVRFGDLPKSGKSTLGGTRPLEGVSVYSADFHLGQYWVNLSGLKNPTARNDFNMLRNRPAYLVTGREIGTGSTWEPLLTDIKVIRPLKPSEITR